MALKMRFLYYSGKAKIKNMAELVKVEFDLAQNHNAIDIIPPAYSCENERLVILAVSGKGEPDDVLRRFCSELNKKKAQNVALLVDGDEKMANRLLEVLKETGTNVIDNVHYVESPFKLFGAAKVSDDEKKQLLDWVRETITKLQ